MITAEDMHELAKALHARANCDALRPVFGGGPADAVVNVADVIDDWAGNLAQKEFGNENP